MAADSSKLVFEDHFLDNRHQWYAKASADIVARIDAHHYRIEHKHGFGSWLVWNLAEVDPFYERPYYRMQFVLEKLNGPDCGFGVVWQLADTDNRFEFVISEFCYEIGKRKDGIQQSPVPWNRCGYIKPANAINVLEIRRNNAMMEFYINSQRIEELPMDTSMSGTRFGFIIYSNITIKVHSVIITASDSMQNNSYKRDDFQSTGIEHLPPANDSLDKVFADLNGLIGHAETKQQFVSLANFLKVQTERRVRGFPTVNVPLHLVLCGPPGTGKTTIARLVGRLYKQLGCLQCGQVIEVDRAGIIGGYIGQTALRINHAIERALDGVLFIDEAYSLVGPFSNDYGHEAIQVLLKRMEDHRDRLAVIVAGYNDPMMTFMDANPGLQSRFTRCFYLDHYTPQDLTLIFAKFCHENRYVLERSAQIALEATFEMAYRSRDQSFGNGRYARTIFEQTIEKQANRIAGVVSLIDDEVLALITAADLGVVDL
jgi:AAA+ superfamily predicted ATPase